MGGFHPTAGFMTPFLFAHEPTPTAPTKTERRLRSLLNKIHVN